MAVSQAGTKLPSGELCRQLAERATKSGAQNKQTIGYTRIHCHWPPERGQLQVVRASRPQPEVARSASSAPVRCASALDKCRPFVALHCRRQLGLGKPGEIITSSRLAIYLVIDINIWPGPPAEAAALFINALVIVRRLVPVRGERALALNLDEMNFGLGRAARRETIWPPSASLGVGARALSIARLRVRPLDASLVSRMRPAERENASEIATGARDQRPPALGRWQRELSRAAS